MESWRRVTTIFTITISMILTLNLFHLLWPLPSLSSTLLLYTTLPISTLLPSLLYTTLPIINPTSLHYIAHHQHYCLSSLHYLAHYHTYFFTLPSLSSTLLLYTTLPIINTTSFSSLHYLAHYKHYCLSSLHYLAHYKPYFLLFSTLPCPL